MVRKLLENFSLFEPNLIARDDNELTYFVINYIIIVTNFFSALVNRVFLAVAREINDDKQARVVQTLARV